MSQGKPCLEGARHRMWFTKNTQLNKHVPKDWDAAMWRLAAWRGITKVGGSLARLSLESRMSHICHLGPHFLRLVILQRRRNESLADGSALEAEDRAERGPRPNLQQHILGLLAEPVGIW